jgi:hypothetical protein
MIMPVWSICGNNRLIINRSLVRLPAGRNGGYGQPDSGTAGAAWPGRGMAGSVTTKTSQIPGSDS